MYTDLKAITIDHILSEFHVAMLSEAAKKLYSAIWFQMKIRSASQVWFSDEEASIRARLLIQFVPAARTELFNVGLLTGRQGVKQWSYEYVEQSYDASEDELETGQ